MIKHFDHTHGTVAEVRACTFGTPAPAAPQATAPAAPAKATSIVLDRLRRQAGQAAPSVCRTNTQATQVARSTRTEHTAYPASPKAIKYAKDLIAKRDTKLISKAAGDVMLLVLEGKPVDAKACSLLIDDLRAMPRLPEERLAKRAELMAGFAALANGEQPAEQAQPADHDPQVERRVLWSTWREMAADLVATSGHPSGARFAIKNLAGANDLSFWWVSAHKDQRGTFYKLRQVIGGGRREEVRDPQRMIDIAKRINEAGAREAMILFGQELGSCGHCGRELTNEESRAAGIGPVCRSK